MDILKNINILLDREDGITDFIDSSALVIDENELVKVFVRIMSSLEDEEYDMYTVLASENIWGEYGDRTLTFLKHYILPKNRVRELLLSRGSNEPVEKMQLFDEVVKAGEGIDLSDMHFYRDSCKLISTVGKDGSVTWNSSLPNFGRFTYLNVFLHLLVSRQYSLNQQLSLDDITELAKYFTLIADGELKKQRKNIKKNDDKKSFTIL